MKTAAVLLLALALTVPLTGANGQSAPNLLPPGFTSWWRAEGNCCWFDLQQRPTVLLPVSDASTSSA